jgi:hypothetical protein
MRLPQRATKDSTRLAGVDSLHLWTRSPSSEDAKWRVERAGRVQRCHVMTAARTSLGSAHDAQWRSSPHRGRHGNSRSRSFSSESDWRRRRRRAHNCRYLKAAVPCRPQPQQRQSQSPGIERRSGPLHTHHHRRRRRHCHRRQHSGRTLKRHPALGAVVCQSLPSPIPPLPRQHRSAYRRPPQCLQGIG